MNYDQCFAFTVGIEGGYVNDPKDPGGETKFGLSKRANPDLDIPNLTIENAKLIYRDRYWNKINGDQLPLWMTCVMFDAAVHHGWDQAARWMQRIVGATDDGRIGAQTIAKCRIADPAPTLFLFMGERLRFMSGLKNWDHNSEGWAKRIATILMEIGNEQRHSV